MMENFQEASPFQQGPTVFMRHPESVHNIEPTSLFDIGDPELTDLGRLQAVKMAGFVADRGLSTIVCSPALRTVHAAEIIGRALGQNIDIYEEEGLRELNWGSWAGKEVDRMFTDTEKMRAAQEGLDFRANPEAETMREVHARVQDVVDKYEEAVYLTSNFTIKSAVVTELDWPRMRVKGIKILNGQAVEFNPLSEETPLQTLFLPESR